MQVTMTPSLLISITNLYFNSKIIAQIANYLLIYKLYIKNVECSDPEYTKWLRIERHTNLSKMNEWLSV